MTDQTCACTSETPCLMHHYQNKTGKVQIETKKNRGFDTKRTRKRDPR